MKKTLTALALTMALAPLAGAWQTGYAADASTMTQSRDKGLTYMNQQLAKNEFRYVMDWPAVSIYAAGESVTSARWTGPAGKNGVTWREADVLNSVNISDATTDFESGLLGVLAAKQNPRAFGKKDFVQAILSSQRPNGKFADTIYGFGEDLLNSHIYGIIGLYAAGQPIPNAQLAADYLIGKQRADGGFNWASASPSDTDVTAMALIAMKGLNLDANHAAVQKTITFLKNAQRDSGGFASLGSENSDTSAIVIEALLMWDIDPSTWKKGTANPVDNLLSYQNADGSFSHLKGQTGTNLMATQNAVSALSGLLRGASVYERLHDESVSKAGAWTPAFPDLPFSHPYYVDSMKLVNLGVMNGRTDGRFSPEDGVTREQFAKILVLGAGLKDEVGARTSLFKDLDYNGWANPYVKVAYDHRFMVGTAPDLFSPVNPLTGGQVMTILVRMLGLESQAKAYEQRDGKGWPHGHVLVAQEQGLFYPGYDTWKNATRAEVGYAFNRYYDKQIVQ